MRPPGMPRVSRRVAGWRRKGATWLPATNESVTLLSTPWSFLLQTYSPFALPACIWQSHFGFTDTPPLQMLDYVTAKTSPPLYYVVAKGLPQHHFGFAWAPHTEDHS